MAGPGNRRRGRRDSQFDMLPSYVTSDNEPQAFTPAKSQKKWHANLNRETVRELVLVAAGLLIVLWLFFGDNGGQNYSQSYAGRPTVLTESPLIVPSVAGSGREGVKQAPGDMRIITETENAPAQGGKSPLYIYNGAKSPSTVIVTCIDDVRYPADYNAKIIENRVEYARAHDYGVFVRFTKDFVSLYEGATDQSTTWAQVGISREAMEAFPKAENFWYLDQSALIMNPLVDIKKEFGDASHLQSKMLANARVVRDSDNGQTPRKQVASDVDFVFTRDDSALSTTSYIWRNTFEARTFLEFWMDPCYRRSANLHNTKDVLLHMLKWHSTFMSRTTVVSPKLLASFANPPKSSLTDELEYTDGDFTAVFHCDYNTEACKKDFQTFWNGRGRVKP